MPTSDEIRDYAADIINQIEDATNETFVFVCPATEMISLANGMITNSEHGNAETNLALPVTFFWTKCASQNYMFSILLYNVLVAVGTGDAYQSAIALSVAHTLTKPA